MSSSVVLPLLVAVFVAGGVLPPHSASAANNFTVGGDAGWNPFVNYTAWSKGMEFRVGDRLIFKYREEAHNVAIVGGAEFQACNASAARNVLASGDDVVLLQLARMEWYISGVGDDCANGQKLAVDVLPAAAPPPSPASPPPAPGSPVTPPPPSPSPPSPPPPNPSAPPPRPPPPPAAGNGGPAPPPASLPPPPSSSWRIAANMYAAAIAAAAAAAMIAA